MTKLYYAQQPAPQPYYVTVQAPPPQPVQYIAPPQIQYPQPPVQQTIVIPAQQPVQYVQPPQPRRQHQDNQNSCDFGVSLALFLLGFCASFMHLINALAFKKSKDPRARKMAKASGILFLINMLVAVIAVLFMMMVMDFAEYDGNEMNHPNTENHRHHH